MIRKKLKKTRKTFFTLIFLTFIGAGLGFVTGIKYRERTYTLQIEKLAQEMQDKNQDLQSCIADVGTIIGKETETYDTKKFGIYSPLFENKQVKVTKYSYKQTIITQRDIELGQNESSGNYANQGIELWEFSSARGGTLIDQAGNFVIFGGYENYLNRPRLLSVIMSGWKEKFINTYGITINWAYGNVSKHLGAFYLDFYIPNLPTGHPALIRLWDGSFIDGDEHGEDFQAMKKSLQEVANTISFHR